MEDLTGLPRLIYYGLIGLVGDGKYAENQTAIFLCGFALVILSYLLGSVNFAVIISNKLYHDDIRTHGSGNAGSTNMIRTYGMVGGMLTFAGDFLKSAFATAMGLLLMPWRTGFAFVCGIVCLVGHAFPIFFSFRGGKCVASLCGVVIVLNPPLWIMLMIVFALTVALSKYISLGSLVSVGMFPVANTMIPFWFAPPPPAALVSTLIMAVLVFYLHRENIKRLVAGNESKFSFRKKKE